MSASALALAVLLLSAVECRELYRACVCGFEVGAGWRCEGVSPRVVRDGVGDGWRVGRDPGAGAPPRLGDPPGPTGGGGDGAPAGGGRGARAEGADP